MNIFKILSSNDGRINEPSISSFLAYLLDYEDHGMADLLLKSILFDFREENKNFFKNLNLSNLTQYKIEINPERTVYLEKKHRDIDIVIDFFENNISNVPLYSICFENKITDSSIQRNNNQLEEELEGLQREYAKNGYNTEIYFCFITLQDSNISNDEFNNFKYDKKIHLHWKGSKSIHEKILNILEQERNAEIEPIPSDVKFIIKSFLTFIKTDFKSFLEEKQEKYQRTNYGKPTREHFKDFIKNYELNKDYEKKELMNKFSKYIKEKCNKDLNQSQLSCIMYEITANEKNRIHYNVKENNVDEKNILYYPDENNKSIVRRYSKEIKNVNVYYLEK